MKIFLLIFSFFFLPFFLYINWILFRYFLTGDAGFQFSETINEFSVISAWDSFSGFGGSIMTLWGVLITIIKGFLFFLGDSGVVDKFIIFWWIIFGLPIASFFVLSQFFKKTISSVIGSFYFCYGSYYFTIITHGHVGIVLGTIFALFSFYFFLRYLEENKLYWCIFSAFSMIISGSYDFRIVYIFFGLFLAFVLWEAIRNSIKNKKVIFYSFKNFFIFSSLFFLLSFYWIIPTFIPQSGGVNQFLGRDLFGNDYFELQEALFLSHPFWTGYGVQWMSNQPTPWWLTILGILAFAGFWVGRKNPYVVFFALIALIGIFLGKQVDPPFGNSYYWLYENLPGFNAFREASKFYVLIALGYSVGLASLINWLLPPSHHPKEEIK